MRWWGGGLVGVLVGLAVLIQVARDARYPSAVADPRLLYVTSGAVAGRLALSYDALLADVYWIRALQHFGGDRRRNVEGSRRFELLYPLLDLTTSLDPDLTVAYRFGAIFLMEPSPGGAGRPDLAIKLLEKGIAQTPHKWEYYLDVGFVHYWQLQQYQEAAAWFLRGSEQPDAPWWLRSYAAVMLTRGGDREASRFLWRGFSESSENEWLKENAEWRLLQLDALDQVDALSAVVREYRARSGAWPRTWQDLVSAGALRGEPVDPSGAAYVLDAATGGVSVATASRLHPLPVDPPAGGPLAQTRGPA